MCVGEREVRPARVCQMDGRMLSCVRGTLRAPFRLASVFHLQLGRASVVEGTGKCRTKMPVGRGCVIYDTLLCAVRLVASLVGTRGTPGTGFR